jgi:hypothetical protein
MVTCPTCLYAENSDSAMICIKCGAELPDTRASIIRRPLATEILSPENVLTDDLARRRYADKLQRTDMAIYVGNAEQPVLVNLTREVLLGRFGAASPDAGMPTLDLVSFGAMENGVSRKHALLRRLGADVVVLDLESTNGTWLNGVRLTPNQPVMLRSGDKVLLARLMLQIFMA